MFRPDLAQEQLNPEKNNEAYALERKEEDFAALRQAAIERADPASRHPTVVLPGVLSNLSHSCIWITPV